MTGGAAGSVQGNWDPMSEPSCFGKYKRLPELGPMGRWSWTECSAPLPFGSLGASVSRSCH